MNIRNKRECSSL